MGTLAREDIFIAPLARAGWRKYHNTPITKDGLRFDSKAEANRWSMLRLLERAGQIERLTHHPRFPLHVAGQQLGYYEADFTYYQEGVLHIEDVKGVKTPLYKWKKKHVEAEYGQPIREVAVR